MVTETGVKKVTPEMELRQQLIFGNHALRELRMLIKSRPAADKLIVNGKQYLFFYDWQTLGAFFGITASVMKTEVITQDKPSKEAPGFVFKEPIGYWARAVAFKDGKEMSAAEAVCFADEKNWGAKPRFQWLSMAETRACAKALRNVLQWVVKLPDEKNLGPEIADEGAEELPMDKFIERG
jgi:hypothetical protein